ncbi:MAG: hypothetical protein J6C46_10270 [Clostridia bacterium]|nr:hypothetical protein [Clostridia bacterium]
MWLKIIGSAIALVGCILIFDSRRIVKKSFSFGDENVTTLGIKIFGTIMALIGGFLCII